MSSARTENGAVVKKGRLVMSPLLIAALALGGVACGDDDSAGPESGASVEDVTNEEGVEEGVATDTEDGTDDASLTEEAASFVGQQVTISATISEIVGPSAFRVGGEDFGGESLLVLSAPAPNFSEMGLDVNEELVSSEAVLQVTGTVRHFDIAEFEEEFGVDYDEAVFEESEGENVIVADRVTTLTGQELTVAGEVERVLSTVAFRLSGVGWDVLVLDAEQAVVDESDFVQVTGTVRRFDIATFEEEFGRDLDDALYEEFDGDLVLVAQNVQPAQMQPPASTEG